jgi:hypothetical protein
MTELTCKLIKSPRLPIPFIKEIEAYYENLGTKELERKLLEYPMNKSHDQLRVAIYLGEQVLSEKEFANVAHLR